MNRIQYITILAFLIVSPAKSAETIISCQTLTHPELNKLEKQYAIGDIRVFWTENEPASGTDHRLPPVSQVDENENGVPDFIENVAKQADVARRSYNLLGFRDPLESPKFRAVERIDINILNMAANGIAYDNLVSYPSAPGRGDHCTLRMDISSRLELSGQFTTNWFVVAHEMFHLFQFGQPLFKRSWVNEPLARWAEYTFRLGSQYPLGTPAYTLPTSKAQLQTDVIDAPNSTTANRFWSRLIDLIEAPTDDVRLPSSLLTEQYTDGQSVFKDRALRGAALISAFYQTLDAEDDVVSNSNGWNPYDWPEADQTSAAHDDRILSVIQEVIRHTGITNPEIDAFLQLQ